MTTFVKIGPWQLAVTFDSQGDVDDIQDNKTGEDVAHFFNWETLAMIESIARCNLITERTEA